MQFLTGFETIDEYHQKINGQDLKAKRIRPRYAGSDPEIRKYIAQDHSKVNGDVLIQRIRYFLSKLPYERHDDQKRFHEDMLRSVAPGLYGADYDREFPRMMKKNGWTSIR